MNSFYNLKKLFNKETIFLKKVNNYYGNKFIASIKSSKNNICIVNSPDNYSYMRFNVNPYITQLENFNSIDYLNISEYYKKIFQKFDNHFAYVREKMYNYEFEIDKRKRDEDKKSLIHKSIIRKVINRNNYLNPKIYIEFEENFKNIKYIFFRFYNFFPERKESDFLLNLNNETITIDSLLFSESELTKYLEYNITLIDNYTKGKLE